MRNYPIILGLLIYAEHVAELCPLRAVEALQDLREETLGARCSVQLLLCPMLGVLFRYLIKFHKSQICEQKLSYS